MKEINGNSWEELQLNLRRTFSDLYDNYKYLKESLDKRNLELFDEIWKRKDSEYSSSLNFLSKLLEDYYDEKVIVLIDEYDFH